MPSVEDLVSSPVTELATVICSPVEDPRTAQAADHPGMERRPAQPVKTSRYQAPDPMCFGFSDAHGSPLMLFRQQGQPGRQSTRIEAISQGGQGALHHPSG